MVIHVLKEKDEGIDEYKNLSVFQTDKIFIIYWSRMKHTGGKKTGEGHFWC